MPRIRATTVLPARREPVQLDTVDGLTLEGELALPESRPPTATLVTLHPLPTAGGSMESHLIRKMAWRLPALAGLAVLRFNTRGTGGSTGRFDGGEGERWDVAAALDLVEARDLPAVWLVGWSFGTDLALRHGGDPSVVGAILVSPPLKTATDADLDAWALTGRPLVAIIPEYDDYLQPPAARLRFGRVPSAEVVAVPRARHLFVGFAETVLDEIVRRVAPACFPLPQEY
ncbi:MAG: alpha/beta hydrolase [Mycobacteriales bacterium]